MHKMTSQCGLIREQQQLERLGHRADFRCVGMIHRKVCHVAPIRSGLIGRRAGKCGLVGGVGWVA
jgi:hypothetical protein